VPLDATVTTVRQAVDSTDPAIVIAADGFSDKKIRGRSKPRTTRSLSKTLTPAESRQV